MTGPVKVSSGQAEAMGGCAPCQYQKAASHQNETGPKDPKPKSVIVVDPTKEHWIGIELADSAKKPVPYAEFVVTLPTGQRVPGALDANGKSRIEGIDPGTCTIEFPTLDRRDFV